MSPEPPLRVRVGRSYHMDFTVEVGQRNAVFVRGPLNPFSRWLRNSDAVAPLVDRRFDLVHGVNAMPLLTSRPSIVTFEDLPRTPPDRRIAWLERVLRRRRLGRRYVAVVAMSQDAQRCLRPQHRGWSGLAQRERKLVLLYPAVEARREAPKRGSGSLRLLFVGNHFIRKGGPALVQAHAELVRAGVPVETTVVSSLYWSRRDSITPPAPAWDHLAEQLVEHVGGAAGDAATYGELSAGALARVGERFDSRLLRDRLEDLNERCREAA